LITGGAGQDGLSRGYNVAPIRDITLNPLFTAAV
jgi:hypothetical protein